MTMEDILEQLFGSGGGGIRGGATLPSLSRFNSKVL